MKNFILSTIFAAMASLVSADGGAFNNNCGVAVYARSATCENTGHDATLVQPGETYDHNLSSSSPGCNRAIKIATSVNGLDSDCYNVEWVIDTNDEMWYNLSHDHGDPVGEFKRTMAVDGCEDVIQCEAGDSSCDYPILKSCTSAQMASAAGTSQQPGFVHFNMC